MGRSLPWGVRGEYKLEKGGPKRVELREESEGDQLESKVKLQQKVPWMMNCFGGAWRWLLILYFSESKLAEPFPAGMYL